MRLLWLGLRMFLFEGLFFVLAESVLVEDVVVTTVATLVVDYTQTLHFLMSHAHPQSKLYNSQFGNPQLIKR